LKVSKGMAIWTNSIDIGLMGTYTCSMKFKLVDGIKLIGCSNMINVGTSMVPIFKSYIINIKDYFSSKFQNGNHNKLTPLVTWLVFLFSW
jgi:uncharacterized sodium:solute symporter family permease YidK